MIKLNPPPQSGLLKWVISEPEQAAAYLSVVFALQNLEAVINNKRYPIQISESNAVINLTAIKGYTLPNPIANSITNTLSVSTQLNTLLAALRSVGQLPT